MGREVYDPENDQRRTSKPAKEVTGLIKTWQITGPFKDKSADTLKAFAPAHAADVTWKPITKGFEPNRIDIQANIGEHDDCSAFVRTTVISPKKQTVTLHLNADDLVCATLNGKLVEAGQIELQEGDNTLLLKVIDHKKGWRFTCALTRNGKPVRRLKYKAD